MIKKVLLNSMFIITSTDSCVLNIFQAMYGCSLTPGSSKFAEQCRDPDRGVVRGPNYEQDPYVLYTVNAVYAGIALFFHSENIHSSKSRHRHRT